MQLFLIRHGATEFSREFRFCGSTDVPLSRDGARQARRLQSLLRTQRIGRIYSSPLLRAVKTAQVTFPRRRIVVSDALREIDFGRLEGLSATEAKKMHPRFYRKWLANPAQADPPGGERIAHCRRRILRLVRHLATDCARTHENVAIVTHGGVIKILLSDILGLGPDGLTRLHVEPASVAVVAFDGRRFSFVVKGIPFVFESFSDG